MNKNQLLNGDKLIAEFIGEDNWSNLDKALYEANRFDLMKYSSSWNWLMPVVEKISDQKHWSINATIEWLNEKYEFDGFYCIQDLYKAVILHLKDKNETN